MVQVYARSLACKHIVWAGPLIDTGATMHLADELRGRPCPTCGRPALKISLMAVRKEGSAFDTPPAPRNAENRLKKVSRVQAARTEQRLVRLGAETGGLAADLKQSALGLAPPPWRDALAKIPVGILRTYEPNAECIRFKDSPLPAIVVHQGLAGYLFKMNRSIYPLVRMTTLRDRQVLQFVEDEKTRTALRVQAVDTALEFLGVGKPRSKHLVEIPPITRVLEMPLTRTMSAFVVCHEYGHAVLNHADQLGSVGRDAPYQLLERSRAMEFEADTWGQDAMTGAFTGGKGLEPSLAVLDELFSDGAPEMKKDISHGAPCLALLYFEFLDVVEERLARSGIAVAGRDELTRRRARMAGGASAEHSTHPSNKERFQALYAHLSEHSNFTTHTWVGAFETLLDEIKADLDKFIDRTGALPGRRLAPRWSWPRRWPKRETSSWRTTISNLEDDDRTRSLLEKAFDNLEGRPLELDEEALWRRFEALKARAQDHYDNGEYAEAEKIYAGIFESPETLDTVPLYPLLGMCREKLGDTAGAIAAYRRCLEVVPGSDVAAVSGFYLGKLLIDQDDPDGAETALTAALAVEVVDLRAMSLFWLGTIAHGRNDFETALRRYQEAYALRDQEFTILPAVVPRAALNIGGIFEHRGQFAEAAEMFTYARDHPAVDPPNRAIAEQHLRAVRGR